MPGLHATMNPRHVLAACHMYGGGGGTWAGALDGAERLVAELPVAVHELDVLVEAVLRRHVLVADAAVADEEAFQVQTRVRLRPSPPQTRPSPATHTVKVSDPRPATRSHAPDKASEPSGHEHGQHAHEREHPAASRQRRAVSRLG